MSHGERSGGCGDAVEMVVGVVTFERTLEDLEVLILS